MLGTGKDRRVLWTKRFERENETLFMKEIIKRKQRKVAAVLPKERVCWLLATSISRCPIGGVFSFRALRLKMGERRRHFPFDARLVFFCSRVLEDWAASPWSVPTNILQTKLRTYRKQSTTTDQERKHTKMARQTSPRFYRDAAGLFSRSLVELGKTVATACRGTEDKKERRS